LRRETSLTKKVNVGGTGSNKKTGRLSSRNNRKGKNHRPRKGKKKQRGSKRVETTATTGKEAAAMQGTSGVGQTRFTGNKEGELMRRADPNCRVEKKGSEKIPERCHESEKTQREIIYGLIGDL